MAEKEMIDNACDKIRKLVENCTGLQGILLFNEMASGYKKMAIAVSSCLGIFSYKE